MMKVLILLASVLLLAQCWAKNPFRGQADDDSSSSLGLLVLAALNPSRPQMIMEGQLLQNDGASPLAGANIEFGNGVSNAASNAATNGQVVVTNNSGIWALQQEYSDGEIQLRGVVTKDGVGLGSFVVRIRFSGSDEATVQISAQGNFALTVTAHRPRPTDTERPAFGNGPSEGVLLVGPRTARLSWRAASDNVTPASRLLYEVYVQKTTQPALWPERPTATIVGQTSLDISSLEPDTQYEFLVRVVDAAGNRDFNPELNNMGWTCTMGHGYFVAIQQYAHLSGFAHDSNTWIPLAPYDRTYLGFATTAVYGGGKVVLSTGRRSSDGFALGPTSFFQYPVGWQINSMAYGNGRYVGVGYNGLRLNLQETNWSNAVLGGSNLNSVAFGNGVFVAVGNNGRRIRSSDGINWTNDITDADGPLTSIAFGNGVFVAVGSSRSVISYDGGITWSALEYLGVSIAFGNGTFVIVNGTGSRISTDGVSWTGSPASNQGADFPSRVVFGKNSFMAWGSGYFESSDGLSWYRKQGVYVGPAVVDIIYVPED